ncbi:MAG: coenzyme F420-0:L-glutamate ligase [Anaerolineales bacterium]|nr:coenzyme F420-0:L-glutamate ligase [Anaerolineales bacterium]
MSLVLNVLKNIPLIREGDDLAEILLKSLAESNLELQDNDVLVLAQKIVSKAEGRMVNLADVYPSAAAFDLAPLVDKDPRLLELILRESSEVLRIRKGVIVVEHKLGFVCANAGIDHSNVAGEGKENAEYVLLLPENPDASARRLREEIWRKLEKTVGVMIIDSHGRAWRNGTVGVCIGLSGVPALIDERGQTDLFGYTLKATVIGAADELAAAASLVIGQAAEGTPVAHVRGFPYPLTDGSLQDLIRAKELDMFR